MEYLFNVLINDGDRVILKRKTWNSVVKSGICPTDYDVMKKYEEYLCRHKLKSIYFELYDTSGELHRVSNRGKIEIKVPLTAKYIIDDQVDLWKRKCSSANIIL